MVPLLKDGAKPAESTPTMVTARVTLLLLLHPFSKSCHAFTYLLLVQTCCAHTGAADQPNMTELSEADKPLPRFL